MIHSMALKCIDNRVRMCVIDICRKEKEKAFFWNHIKFITYRPTEKIHKSGIMSV